MITGLGILVTCGFVVISAIVDAEHILKKEYIESHRSRWFLRLCFFLAMGFHSWIWIIASALFFAATFDQLLNRFRELPFWYLGTVAKWDIFWSKRMWLYIPIKILLLLVSLFLFLYL